ncbi:TM2 domain-containing protein [Mycoplasma seminis]|uniref:TM2 domain-containing protein n=1 Tax=Mycoplasma seminis TaxID=512749 RepID=A0ABY9HAH6_9MOLU|nr:TM2 domain-containing protein [Mycoplasma seminis]WLP85542.1 TM2 domain-containing protein [Mycoplasma seminis]
MKVKSTRSWLVNLLLSIFLGEFGIDRLYGGRVGLFLLKLLTAGGCAVWWIIDIILAVMGLQKDNQGLYIRP